MKVSAWDKFYLLLWKNWIVQLRHPIQTLFEVLVPVLVCTLLIAIRSLVKVREQGEVKYNATSLGRIDTEFFMNADVKLVLAFSPQNPVLQKLVDKVAAEFNFSASIPIENAFKLECYSMTHLPFASIEFENRLKVRKRSKLLKI